MKHVLVLCGFLLALVSMSAQPVNARKFLERKTKLCNDNHFRLRSKFTVRGRRGNIPCRRLTDLELLQRYNCTGTYQEKNSAFTLKRADFRARRVIKASKQAIRNGSSINALASARWKINRLFKGRRNGRSMPGPGETTVVNCVLRCTTDTETNNKRACGECSTIYQQPSTPRRIPLYILEQICNPNESSDVYSGNHLIGKCVQQYINHQYWEASGEWVYNSQLSAYTEEFVPYTHRIKSGCAFQFYPNIPPCS